MAQYTAEDQDYNNIGISTSSVLLSPIKLNKELTLKNRVIMAPMTRCKALEDLTPNPIMAEYYAKRSNCGLIITEGTIVSADGQGLPRTPGIFTNKQVMGWKKITDEVHNSSGKIFLQLWHSGRVSHPMYLNGEKPVAPSPIPIHGRIPRTKLNYLEPREISSGEIKKYVEHFSEGAQNAIYAGFDGVELHAANGYLIDQFLHHSSNIRNDNYGRTPHGMIRFLLEIIETITCKINSNKVGVRISPAPYINGISYDDRDKTVFKYLLQNLNNLSLAYVHTAISNDQCKQISLNNETVSSFTRKYYKGNLIASGNYNEQLAESTIQAKQADMVAFGRSIIANPDIVYKFKNNIDITEYNSNMLSSIN
jgi:N-ethylmaleimide reductase